jgi:hypothetical protein
VRVTAGREPPVGQQEHVGGDHGEPQKRRWRWAIGSSTAGSAAYTVSTVDP